MNFIEAVTALKEGKGKEIASAETSYVLHLLNGNLVNATNNRPCISAEEISGAWILVPKPKVKKRIEGWVNVYLSASPAIGELVWGTKEEAYSVRHSSRKYLGDPLHIEHFYEVEE